MKLVFILTLALPCSPLAHADESCAELVGGFSSLMRCWGTSVDSASGQAVDFTIDLNARYAELESGSVKHIYNEHRVELRRPFLKILTRTSFASFVHLHPDCVRRGDQVRCTGREDDRQFDLSIDLTAGTATGTYRDIRFANPEYQRSYAFIAANALICR